MTRRRDLMCEDVIATPEYSLFKRARKKRVERLERLEPWFDWFDHGGEG